MEKWVEIRRTGNFTDIAKQYGISPITARLLRNRDLLEPGEMEAFLHPGFKQLNDPLMLKGMKRVICVLREKIEEGSPIRIIGDYDVDGICATFILYKGLSFFGAKADYAIPHRIEDGYGINQKMIQAAYDAGRNTIITCDNGIAAINETEYANSLGMTMLITDHHEIPFELINGVKEHKLPDADGIVDPKMPGETYPFSGICGAYVAYQTVLAYAKEYGVEEKEEFKALQSELLEFAALATVCDVMELKSENRSLVFEGMKRMENSGNIGLSALIEVTGLKDKKISPFHLGFVIGPCLNASGRLDTSMRALELFLETDREAAIKKATDLKELNDERKNMTLTATQEAFKIVDSCEKIDDVLVIYLKDCHESLAGIIAGRVREHYGRPTFVITKTKEGLKGSGRGIDAYDMYEALNEVKDCLTKFGGHKLAAGISLEEDKLDEFRQRLNANSKLKESDFSELVRIDMVLDFEYANLKLVHELECLEPYGNGNDKPLFALQNVRFIYGTRMGKTKSFGKYRVQTPNGMMYDMIYFGDASEFEAEVEKIYGPDKAKALHSGKRTDILLDICYQLDINSYMGKESVQFMLKHFR